MVIERYIGQAADTLKRDRGLLSQLLQEAGATMRGSAITCPFCDDKRPSAGIYESNGDGFRYKCHKCGFQGDILDVIARLDGIEVAEVFRRLKGERPQKQPKVYPDLESLRLAMPGKVEAVFQYSEPKTGKADMLVIRSMTPDGKTFRQARPVSGGFVFQAPAKPWPLYNRKRLQTADTVVVVEGEGKVHALHEYSVIATTSPGGALKAEYADWTSLAGKNVILWPDADEPGRAHTQQVEDTART